MRTGEIAAPIDQPLLWASLPAHLLARLPPSAMPRHVWMGLGLTSDLGLPLCAMHMFLAAKAYSPLVCGRAEATVLLADVHAIEGGASAASARRRCEARMAEVEAIGDVIRCRFRPLLASSMSADPEFAIEIARVREWLRGDAARRHGAVSEYTIRAVADMLFFSHRQGIKIGWSSGPSLDAAKGQHHEPETDLLAAAIDDGVTAVYVRHGITLDSDRPRAAPYTESRDASSRLMLTGAGSGGFSLQSDQPRVTPRRRRALLQHVTLIVDAFESLVSPLPGAGVLAKAESLHDRIATTLAAGR